MEDIRYVPWPVCDASSVWILGREDELLELATVDPVELVEDGQAREIPERVAHLQSEKGAITRIMISDVF